MAWTITWQGRAITVDPATLTMVESEHRRKILKTIEDPDNYDAVSASAWIVLRRTDQAVTFEEFRGSLTRGDIDAAVEAGEGDDPEV